MVLMNNKKNVWNGRAKSFSYALGGLLTLFKDQPNARIHVVAAIMAIAMGLFLGISSVEWILICLCITLVISAEAFNSSLEYIADFVCAEKHHLIKKAKDVAAGAVLLTAIFSVVTGLFIFLPKLLVLFKNSL